MSKIGIFGGTFDPIHHGHLILARDALETLPLDSVLFVPAAISPHKLEREPTPPEIRLEMLRAALEGEPRFCLDAMELERPAPSYAVESMEILRQRGPSTEFFYLIGEDNVARLPTWHRFPELSEMVQFVVLDRSGLKTGASLSRDPPASGHFRDGYQKQGCHRAFHSLSRTAGGRKDYPRPPALQGASKITAENLAKTCADLAANKKAEEIVVLDLQGISTFTDFFVICSGTSEPHLKAIAGEIEGRLKADQGLRPVSIDGFPASQWIVLDYMQVIVHVFHREKREFYSLEDLWGDAPRLAWEPAEQRREN